ncbi:hypothetical protein F1847_05665 [Thermodesulfobacterium sp. TA1]|uniref:hypothetical protein n=1 Tax=Thermodesulfobacterium sp. TA1 TaxID=2234087 RepID=UPI0012318D82|nr:hypothetical protein [Thermodesulfobacterium sp. TA1]QER42252.1 hypothetical protein F1847_05665 [Thermodesulfobacterium sp. TA1]
MGLILNQSKGFKGDPDRKNLNLLIGKILHFILENLLVCEKNIEYLFKDKSLFSQRLGFYLDKALAFYLNLFFERQKIREEIKKTLDQLFESLEFKNLVSQVLRQAKEGYSEVEGFLRNKNSGEVKNLRPDLIFRTSSGWVIFELKFHQLDILQDREQLGNYVSLLQNLYPGANIEAYLIVLNPFKIEKQDVTSFTNPTQLSLFENLS